MVSPWAPLRPPWPPLMHQAPSDSPQWAGAPWLGLEAPLGPPQLLPGPPALELGGRGLGGLQGRGEAHGGAAGHHPGDCKEGLER